MSGLPHIRLWFSFVYQGVWIETNAERDAGRVHYTANGDGQPSPGPLRQFEYEVDQVDTLVSEAVRRLTLQCPEHIIGGSASEDL